MEEKFKNGSKQNWLRDITKSIRRNFKNIDTNYFSDEDLENKLEEIFGEIEF